jgi:hypothetical protein
MSNFKLEYYFKGVLKGTEQIKAFDKKEARQMSWESKIGFSLKLRDNDGNFFDHRKLAVKIVPIEEKRKIEAEEKPMLEDKFNWY